MTGDPATRHDRLGTFLASTVLVAMPLGTCIPLLNIIPWDWASRAIGESVTEVFAILAVLGFVVPLLAMFVPARVTRWLFLPLIATSVVSFFLFYPSVHVVGPPPDGHVDLLQATIIVHVAVLEGAMALAFSTLARRAPAARMGAGVARAIIMAGSAAGGGWAALHVILGNSSPAWVLASWIVMTCVAAAVPWLLRVREVHGIPAGQDPAPATARGDGGELLATLVLLLGGSILLFVAGGAMSNAEGIYDVPVHGYLPALAVAVAALCWLSSALIARKARPGRARPRGASVVPGILVASVALPALVLRVAGSALVSNLGLSVEEFASSVPPSWVLIGAAGAVPVVHSLVTIIQLAASSRARWHVAALSLGMAWVFLVAPSLFISDLGRLFFDSLYGWYFDVAIAAIVVLAALSRLVPALARSRRGSPVPVARVLTRAGKATLALVLVMASIATMSAAVSVSTYMDLPNRRPYPEHVPDWSNLFSVADASAPAWAIAEYKALQAYKEWVYFWIDNQRPDGSFGGRLEDDVELYKTFPVLTWITGDQRVNASVSKLAEAMWTSGTIKDGYTNRNPYWADVEHMAEPVSYTIPMMLMLDPGNPAWLQRAYEAAVHVGMDWTLVNEAGQRLVRGHYYNAHDFDTSPGRDVENPENGRALKHATITAWHDRSPTLLQWLHEWASSLAFYANLTSTDPASPLFGKPRGFVPSEIDPVTGTVGPYTRDWYSDSYKAVNVSSYSWKGGFNDVRHQVDAMLTIGALVNDTFILDVLGAMLAHLLQDQAVNGIPANKPTLDDDGHLVLDANGTAIWKDAAEVRMPNTAILWQKLTRNETLNARLQRWGEAMTRGLRSTLDGPYQSGNMSTDGFDRATARFESDPDPEALGPAGYLGWWYGDRTNKTLATLALENIAEMTRQMWDQPSRPIGHNAIQDRDDWEYIGYTDHTAQQQEPSGESLMWFATGGIGSCEARYPYLPVTYENSDYSITPLVRDENATAARVLLYNFGETSRTITLRFWQLNDGTYQLSGGIDANEDDEADTIDHVATFDTNGRNTRVEITLPARAVYVVRVAPTGPTSLPVSPPANHGPLMEALFNTTRVAVNGRLHDSHEAPLDVRSWAFLDPAGETLVVCLKAKRPGDGRAVTVHVSGVTAGSGNAIGDGGGPVAVDAVAGGFVAGVQVDDTVRGFTFRLGSPAGDPVAIHVVVTLSPRDPVAWSIAFPLVALAGIAMVIARRGSRT